MPDREVAPTTQERSEPAAARASAVRATPPPDRAHAGDARRPGTWDVSGFSGDELGSLLARAALRRGHGSALPAGSLARAIATPCRRRELQRYVYVEGSAKAPAVPAGAKVHAKWCVGKQSWLDTNAAALQIGLRTVQQYTKFKQTWVGHMVYNNDPDPNKAKRPNESDADYESRRQTKLPIDGDYREYDTQPYVPGARGTDRVIVDRTSKRAWYTGDHYANLVELKL